MQVRYRPRAEAPLRVAAAGLAALLLAGCEPGATAQTAGGAGSIYCTVMADPVHRDSSRATIVAPAHFRCDRPGPDTLRLAVALQRKVGRTWTTVLAQEFAAFGAQTTREHSERSRVRVVAAACADGEYRSLVQAVSIVGRTQKRYEMAGRAVTNPCDQPALG